MRRSAVASQAAARRRVSDDTTYGWGDLEEDTGVAFAGDCREVLQLAAMLDATSHGPGTRLDQTRLKAGSCKRDHRGSWRASSLDGGSSVSYPAKRVQVSRRQRELLEG